MIKLPRYIRTYWKKSLQRQEVSASKSREKLPFKGFPKATQSIYSIDKLADEDLHDLNELLAWKCFTVDSHGRRFGNRAWKGKRDKPQEIPDQRIVLLNEYLPLGNKEVVEFGCFEGVHTIGLCQFAKKVVAVDVRTENIVKSMIRCGFYGVTPFIFKHDLDTELLDPRLFTCDVVFHVGVLYHLKDPVRHLQELNPLIRCGILLDTHYALDEQATETYKVDGKSYRYKHYREGGKKDAFAGMSDHAKWLVLEELKTLLTDLGFALKVVEPRAERNGPRVLILAVK